MYILNNFPRGQVLPPTQRPCYNVKFNLKVDIRNDYKCGCIKLKADEFLEGGICSCTWLRGGNTLSTLTWFNGQIGFQSDIQAADYSSFVYKLRDPANEQNPGRQQGAVRVHFTHHGDGVTFTSIG